MYLDRALHLRSATEQSTAEAYNKLPPKWNRPRRVVGMKYKTLQILQYGVESNVLVDWSTLVSTPRGCCNRPSRE